MFQVHSPALHGGQTPLLGFSLQNVNKVIRNLKPGQFQRAARNPIAVMASPSDVFVLDYDGVIADSAMEVASAGLASAAEHWPDLFSGLSSQEQDRILAGLKAARPRLVKGYESMVMARLILEDPQNGVDRILAPGWDAANGLLKKSLTAWDETEGPLIEKFEAWRGNRVAADPSAWISMSPLYKGMGDALADCPWPFYICSSKRGDRLVRLLNAQLGLDLDEDSPRVLSSLIPPNEKKIEALRNVAARPVAADPSTTLHFIDDRFETIEAIHSQAKDLRQRYQLYLAGWGYNTAEERQAAAKLSGVRVLTLSQACELLRFGIVMEVNDGCQDTEEEALNQVYKPYGSVIDE